MNLIRYRILSWATIGLVFVVLAAIAVRFMRLSTIPAWYTDEGFYLNVAWNIAHGRWEIFGVRDWTFVSPLSPTPPLFHLMLAPLLLIFGKTILVLRVVSASFGVATVLLLFLVGRRLFQSTLAGLLPAAVYAVTPVIVTNNRWGLPQNLVGFFLLSSFALLWAHREQPTKRRTLLLGLAAAALAFLTTFTVIHFFLVIAILLWPIYRWRSLLFALLSVTPLVITLSIRAAIVPQAFVADLRMLPEALRALGDSQGLPPFIALLKGVQEFFSRNFFFILSCIGVYFIRPQILRRVLFVTLVVVIPPFLQQRTGFMNFFYPALIFTPLLLLGLGGIAQACRFSGPFSFKVGRAWILFLVCGYSLVLLVQTIAGIRTGLLASYAAKLAYIFQPAVSAQRTVGQYLNSQRAHDAFIIAPNNLNWQLKSRTADISWVACYEYRIRFPNLWDERFALPMGARDALYIVEDRLFPGDASVCAQYRPQIRSIIKTELWPMVFTADRFAVYRNPKR